MAFSAYIYIYFFNYILYVFYINFLYLWCCLIYRGKINNMPPIDITPYYCFGHINGDNINDRFKGLFEL